MVVGCAWAIGMHSLAAYASSDTVNHTDTRLQRPVGG